LWQIVMTRHGFKTVILEKHAFPRMKLCAGWVTPQVFRDLECTPDDYPFGILRLNTLYFHLRGIRIPVRTRQYSIRRYEFDHWLIRRSKTQVIQHRVRRIETRGDEFIVDDRFRARYLIGAGGTQCPVARHLFESPLPHRDRTAVITLEKEYLSSAPVHDCHLWFFQNRLPGYAWLVPKAGGFVNIGLGGKLPGMNRKNLSIHHLWEQFVAYLHQSGHIRESRVAPRGHTYFLGQRRTHARTGNAFIIGDALGLATQDMGEGIGPAVQSGLMAAAAIIKNAPFRLEQISRFSLPGIILAGFKKS
jgi:flavin-dependent dehydrogenase